MPDQKAPDVKKPEPVEKVPPAPKPAEPKASKEAPVVLYRPRSPGVVAVNGQRRFYGARDVVRGDDPLYLAIPGKFEAINIDTRHTAPPERT